MLPSPAPTSNRFDPLLSHSGSNASHNETLHKLLQQAEEGGALKDEGVCVLDFAAT